MSLHSLQFYFLETAAHGGEEHLSFWDSIVASNALNVALVLIVLGFLIKKFNLLAGFDTEQQRIHREIDAAQKQKEEALAELSAIRKRTENLSTEVDEIIRNAQTSAENLSTQILEDAKQAAAKLVDNAEKRLELEQRSAVRQLEVRLMQESIDQARQDLSENMTTEDQGRSVEAFLEELETSGGVR